MLAWTPEEAGKIIETYKMFENKPPDIIMERAEKDTHQKVHKTMILTQTNLKLIFIHISAGRCFNSHQANQQK